MKGIGSLLTPVKKSGIEDAMKISNVLDAASTPEQQLEYNRKIDMKIMGMLYDSPDFAVEMMRQRNDQLPLLRLARIKAKQKLNGGGIHEYARAFKILKYLGINPNEVPAATIARENIYKRLNGRDTDHYRMLYDAKVGTGLELEAKRLIDITNEMFLSGHHYTAARMALAMKLLGYDIGKPLLELASAGARTRTSNRGDLIKNVQISRYAIQEITNKIRASMENKATGASPYSA